MCVLTVLRGKHLRQLGISQLYRRLQIVTVDVYSSARGEHGALFSKYL